MSEQDQHQSHHDTENGFIDLRLTREDAQALVLAVDALQPLLEPIRSELAPETEPKPAASSPSLPDDADALRRARWLARESLREARVAIGERQIHLEQRRAWQEAARRYAAARAALTRTRSGD
jgi:hypothetical protein